MRQRLRRLWVLLSPRTACVKPQLTRDWLGPKMAPLQRTPDYWSTPTPRLWLVVGTAEATGQVRSFGCRVPWLQHTQQHQSNLPTCCPGPLDAPEHTRAWGRQRQPVDEPLPAGDPASSSPRVCSALQAATGPPAAAGQPRMCGQPASHSLPGDGCPRSPRNREPSQSSGPGLVRQPEAGPATWYSSSAGRCTPR